MNFGEALTGLKAGKGSERGRFAVGTRLSL